MRPSAPVPAPLAARPSGWPSVARSAPWSVVASVPSPARSRVSRPKVTTRPGPAAGALGGGAAGALVGGAIAGPPGAVVGAAVGAGAGAGAGDQTEEEVEEADPAIKDEPR